MSQSRIMVIDAPFQNAYSFFHMHLSRHPPEPRPQNQIPNLLLNHPEDAMMDYVGRALTYTAITSTAPQVNDRDPMQIMPAALVLGCNLKSMAKFSPNEY